jgi:hypothetical protein
MPKKSKARRGASKTRKAKISPKEQSERFIKAARIHGADESGRSFEGVFKKIVSIKAR